MWIIVMMLVFAAVCLAWNINDLHLKIDRMESDINILLAFRLAQKAAGNGQPEQKQPYRSTVTPKPCHTEDWLDY